MDLTVASTTAILRKETSDFQIDTGAIMVREDQMPLVVKGVSTLDIRTIASGDIVTIGYHAEQELQRTLDGFLSRLDKKTASKLFQLFDQLQKGVEDAELPDLLVRIQQGQNPPWYARLWAFILRKDGDQLFREFLDSITDLITGRTKTLGDEMTRLERELGNEVQKLTTDLGVLDRLKYSYGEHFKTFTVDAAIAFAFLAKSKQQLVDAQKGLDPNDVLARGEVKEIEDKVRLLESRALALEGVYTRLPADQLVVQQIEQAGVATLQETVTTAGSRFASIKMTLLSIQGAFSVSAVQHLGQQSARMDEQLLKVRGQATKDVAVAAAKAPGDNRLAQASQIEGIISTTREISDLVKQAYEETDRKFEEARGKFAQARLDLATLSTGK